MKLLLYYWLFKLKIYKTIKPRSLTIGDTQGWIGRVNDWPNSKSKLVNECRYMARKGANGYAIEMAAGGNNKVRWYNRIDEILSMYNFLLRLCRAQGLWLFVSIVNDNQGDKSKDPPLSSMMDKCLKLINHVKDMGPDNVAVQIVAEVQTSAGKKLVNQGIDILRGFLLVDNGDNGRPNPKDSRMPFRAWHVGSISKMASIPKDAINCNDHGTAIREVNGGSLTGPAIPELLMKMVATSKKVGHPAVVDYEFLTEKELPKEVINCMVI